MMNYAQAFEHYQQKIAIIGEESEALAFVFKEQKGWSTLDYLLAQNQAISESDLALLEAIYSQLVSHKPAQYILGYALFCDMTLNVDERVLIPRPETEELVELILTENPDTACRVLDIGTGSGAIALALKKGRPNWQVTASDLSQAALDVAQQNAKALALDVSFVLSDVFSAVQGPFDIIVSNPPYIAESDKGEVGVNVLTSEPHSALFAQEDGYAIYRQIIEQASSYLTAKGKLYFEIGYKQGQGLAEMVRKHLPKARVRVIQDMFGKDRMVAVDDVSIED